MVKQRLQLMDLVDWIEMQYSITLTSWQKKELTRLQREADLKIAKRKSHG